MLLKMSTHPNQTQTDNFVTNMTKKYCLQADKRSTRIDRKRKDIDHNDRILSNSNIKLRNALDDVHASKSHPPNKPLSYLNF